MRDRKFVAILGGIAVVANIRERRKILDNNRHKGFPLSVTTSIQGAKQVFSWLKDKLNLNSFMKEVL